MSVSCLIQYTAVAVRSALVRTVMVDPSLPNCFSHVQPRRVSRRRYVWEGRDWLQPSEGENGRELRL